MSTKKTQVYAIALARLEHGYGHIYVNIHEILGYSGGTIKISCQMGGSSIDNRGSYAWEHGLSNDHSIIKLPALKVGFSVLKRIDRCMTKHYVNDRDTGHEVKTFAEYATRILQAASVRKVYVSSRVNAGYSKLEALPCYHPLREADPLISIMGEMERELVATSRGTW